MTGTPTAAPGSWPMVGRGGERQRLTDALASGEWAAVVLTGPAGVGKTTLARAVCDGAAARGIDVLRCIGSASAATLPYGALATLLPAGPAGPDPHALLSAVRASLAQAHDRPPLLWVDDAHLLDPGSAVLVQQLVLTRACRVLATARGGEPLPDALAALWRGGDAEVVELAALDLDRVDEVLTAALGGPVTRGASYGLWRRTGGNPLLLRELVQSLLTDGSLARTAGAWTLADRESGAVQLSTLVRIRLGELSGSERHVTELLALAEALAVDDLTAMVPEADLDALEDRGLLVPADEASLRLAHPVYGEAIRAGLPVQRRRRRQRELAEALARTGRADPLRLATWLLEGAGDPSAALLTEAATLARNRFDLPLAERLAAAAVDARGGVPAQLVLADVQARRGRATQALETLARAAADAATEDEIADVADRRAYVLEMDGRRGEAWDVLRDASTRVGGDRRDVLDAQAAILAVLAGRPPAIASVTGEVLARHGGERSGLPLLARIRLDYAETFALALTGRFAAAEDAAGQAATVLAGLGQGHYPAEMALVGRVVSRLLAGDLAGAEDDARRVEAAALALGDKDAEWTAALYRARVDLALGRVVAAGEHADRALALARELGDRAGQRWAEGARVWSRAWQGDSEAAGSLTDDVLDGLFEADLVRRGLAWADVAAGHPVRARERLAAAADLAAELGQDAVELGLRHDLVRLGEREAAARVGELAAAMPGPGPAAAARHAAAVVAGDGTALLAAAEDLAATGAVVVATEAALAAVSAFRRAGDPRVATRAERRAAELRAGCADVRLPTLVAAVDAPVPLSPREHEIAELAARRLSAAEIADRLVLSRRTVENHLQRIYTKLGVSGRAELAEALRR